MVNWVSILMAGSALLPAVGYAQMATAAEDAGTNDIIVTAQKRSQSIQNVPMSITAISSKDIAERRVYQLSDIASLSPSVSFVDAGGGRGQLVMRGLSTSATPNDKPTISGAVGIYLDDVPIAMALRNPDILPVDMQRIEVLRGPQGTLYGGGSLGGAIKLVTNTPDYRDVAFGGSIEGSVTGHGGLGETFTGYLNLPLGDMLAIRASGYRRFAPGYITNILTGNDDNGAVQTNGGRVEIGFKPSDRFEAIAKILYQKTKVGPGFAAVVREAAYLPAPTQGLNTAEFIDPTSDDTFRFYNLTMTYDLGGATLTSLTTRIDRDVNSKTDGTGAFLIPGVLVPFTELVPVKETMQELRIASSGESRFNWTAGVFYSKARRHYDNYVRAPGFTAVTGIDTTLFGTGVDELFAATNQIREVQKAAFGEATYDILPVLSFTAGVRVYDVKQRFANQSAGVLNGGITTASAVSKSDGVNPRFMLSYKPSGNAMISAQASKGFRLGGANDHVPADLCASDLGSLGIGEAPESFKSESVWNYELNAKTRFAGGRITINPTIYRVDYDNIQILQPLPTCFFNFVTNGGKARSQGVELDMSAELVEGLRLRIGGSYTDAKLLSELPIGVAGQKGSRLPNSPRYSGNAQLRYDFDLSDRQQAYVQGEARYMGNILSQLYDPDPATPKTPSLSSYTVANMRIGTTFNGFEFALFVDNMFDKRASTFGAYTSRLSFTTIRPRVVGFSLSYGS